MLMGGTEIEKQFELYLAQTEAAVGQELDANTRQELKFAYLAGACACFGLLTKASKDGNAMTHMALSQEIVKVGFDLSQELKLAGITLPS